MFGRKSRRANAVFRRGREIGPALRGFSVLGLPMVRGFVVCPTEGRQVPPSAGRSGGSGLN